MGGKSLVEVYSNQCTGGHNALAYGHGASAAAGQRHHPSSWPASRRAAQPATHAAGVKPRYRSTTCRVRAGGLSRPNDRPPICASKGDPAPNRRRW